MMTELLLVEDPIMMAAQQKIRKEIQEMRESTERLKWLSANCDLLYPGRRASWRN